jgi:concanavalin A-like lectin/glucanase superfamily protein
MKLTSSCKIECFTNRFLQDVLLFFAGSLVLLGGVIQAAADSTQNATDITKEGVKQWHVISDWNLGTFADSKVSNQVPNAPPLTAFLTATTSAPTLGQLDGASAMHFEGGQALQGTIKDLPEAGGLGAGKPFALRMTFSAQEKPEGSYAGLFQAVQYGASGFRLMLDQQMNLMAEIFLGEGADKKCQLVSSAPLELGHTYTVELRFDGTDATLLIDGKTDRIQPMALPAAYNGDFLIGTASGLHYDFKGLIKEVAILTPQE